MVGVTASEWQGQDSTSCMGKKTLSICLPAIYSSSIH